MSKETARPYLWMLQASVAFALMGTLTHALGPRCDWQLIAVIRSFCALACTAVLARVAGTPLVLFGARILWVRSVAGSCSMVCTFYALTHLPISHVLTLTNMFPVWVALLSGPLLKEPPPRSVWLAVACSLAGVVLIERPDRAEANLAVLVAAAASLFTAVAMMGLNRLADVEPRAVVVHFSGVALCFCLAAYFVFDHSVEPAALASGWVPLQLLGVGITATVGQILLTRAFAAGSAAGVSVVGLTQIVFALALDVAVFDHRVEPAGLLGMALVVGPTAWLMTQQAADAPLAA